MMKFLYHRKLSTIILILLGMTFTMCTISERKQDTSIPASANAAPTIVALDSCPLPKKVELKGAPKPSVVQVPKFGSHFRTIMTPIGPQKIEFKPPTVTHGINIKADFTNFDTGQGLALSSISCGIRDKQGNLWFGTPSGGVSRYDGKNFTNFTTREGLINNAILSILEDYSGNIWFRAEGNSICRYDGKDFVTFPDLKAQSAEVISMASTHDGKVWFGTSGNGIISFDGKKFTVLSTKQGLINDRVFFIFEDNQGMLWLSTAAGICKYDGKRFYKFPLPEKLANKFIVTCITEDSSRNIWFGTTNGACKFNGDQFTLLTTEQGLSGNLIIQILEDKQRNIWINTYGNGINMCDGSKIVPFNTKSGLPIDAVSCITEDLNGNIWFGTLGKGLIRYNGKSFKTLLLPEKSSLTFKITEDRKGCLWFGTTLGAFRYDGESCIHFTQNQGLSGNNISDILEDKAGNIWFCSNIGVCFYDGVSFTKFTTEQGLAHNLANCIYQDDTGNIWFGTRKGVSCYNGKNTTTYTTEQGLIHNSVRSILVDRKKNTWFCTDKGTSCFDGKRFISFSKEQGLPNNFVMCMLEDHSGNLWFGTDAGISRYDGNNFLNFTISNGLPDDLIYDLVEDENGIIWAGTNKGFVGLKFKAPTQTKDLGAGFCKIDNDALQHHQLALEVYNEKTGYPVKDLGTNAMFIKQKRLPHGDQEDIGTIWGGCGDNTIVRFDPKALRLSNKSITPFIKAIAINETPINWYSLSLIESDSATLAHQEVMAYGRQLLPQERDSFIKKFNYIRFDTISSHYPIPQNLILPYLNNQVTFDFGAIETSRNALIQYRYFLEGYDHEWSPITGKTTATYGNIQEGTYAFKIRAKSAEGIWGKTTVYTFKVLPPWWRTWWAFGFYFMLSVGAIFVFMSFRSATLKRENRILEEKVELRTKQLENSLENLKSTQAQLIQSEKLASLGELTAGIAHEIQNPLNFVNNFAEVSAEMLDEMHEELEKGDTTEAIAIATDLKTNLEKINHHGQRASSIVKGMLEHSRASTGVKEPTDLNALADEYLRLAYHGLRAKDNNFNAKMETHFDADLPLVSVIQQDIGRVLLNLINNAFYAVTEKAKKGIEGYQPTVTISSRKLENAIEICVQDNGNGIPEAIKDKIFQPFFTTKPAGQGTGLGLSLAYDIVTKGHGGTLKVDGTAGSGTVFTLKLTLG